MDYVTYLQLFDKLFEHPKELKNSEYKKYLTGLLDYLYDYLGRVKPLTDMSELAQGIREEFDDRWAKGQFPGWRVRPYN